MSMRLAYFRKLRWLTLLLLLSACANDPEEQNATIVLPTPTSEAEPTVGVVAPGDGRDFLVIATDAPNPNFTDFDKFGNVVGYNNDLMAWLSAVAGFEYEFVVTPHEGILENIASQSNRDYDAVMSALIIPEVPEEGIAYTIPYLEIGQVMVVLADDRTLQSYQDVRPGMSIGVEANSSGEVTARETLQLANDDLSEFDSSVQLLQALADGEVDAAIVDSHTARHFTEAFPEQLKIVGDGDAGEWISSKAYGIAVQADNSELLQRLNQAITQARNDLTIQRLTVAWLIPEESINAGESRVPTPASELIIGMVGRLASMDPATDPDFISWEIKSNSMSGLYVIDSTSSLVPMLAEGAPTISEDKLEYTFTLRRGLRFPDGSELTAEDVKWSVNRAAGLGSFLVNEYLKDSDENNFADDDSVTVLDQYTIRFVLQEPTAHFLSLLATPPYFPISSDCYLETSDPGSTCGGIGPYTIGSWEPDRIRLKANPEWPGRPAPAFENIHVRFFEDASSLVRSMVEFQAIDVAWTGLPYPELIELQAADADQNGTPDFTIWEGPAIFKSYLMFEQSTAPWDKKNVRQAVAFALDRDALAELVTSGNRLPLYSPIPDEIPGHLAVYPQRDLDRAQSLLLAEGYSAENPLEIAIWYTNDARYTPLEQEYAEAIRSQLEETGVFQVRLESAAWEVYRPQIGQCNYPAYLLGWPTPGRPASYLDVTSWTDFFIRNTSAGFCSNYESEEMNLLVTAAQEESDDEARAELYAQIQRLWAEDLPTLDLTQEKRQAVSLNKVENLQIDALGLLHYEVLTKGGG
jgi:peptide/nickel transport system substrate-binding protein